MEVHDIEEVDGFEETLEKVGDGVKRHLAMMCFPPFELMAPDETMWLPPKVSPKMEAQGVETSKAEGQREFGGDLGGGEMGEQQIPKVCSISYPGVCVCVCVCACV